MSGIRVNEWLHNSGSGGIWQTSAGNVGIASSVPTAKLVVTGDANVSGVATAAAFIPSVGQLGHRNLIINGAMQVAQRGTITSILASSVYGGPDRFKAYRVDSPGIWSASQQESAPSGSGFGHCLEQKVTTANGTLDAADIAAIQYLFEGQDLTQVKKGTSSAEQLTLSFWCRTGTSGTYIAELYDSDNTRSCSKSFTHAGSDGWEKKEITFPADTTGAFTHDTNESLQVNIWLAAGSNFTSGSLATTWGSVTAANRAVGQTNLSATLNNYFRITGVQLELGSVATPFEHRTYGEELARCQRYYYKKGDIDDQSDDAPVATFFYNSGTTWKGDVEYPVTMRTPPSLDVSNFTNAFRAYGNTNGHNSDTLGTSDMTRQTGRITFVNASHPTSVLATGVRCNASGAYLSFDAEL